MIALCVPMGAVAHVQAWDLLLSWVQMLQWWSNQMVIEKDV